MNKPEKHILLCASFRVSGEPKGICNKKGATSLLQYLETEMNDRGMDNFLISSTGCMKMCDKGPVMAVYPQGIWYGNISESAIDEILDAWEKGEEASRYIIG